MSNDRLKELRAAEKEWTQKIADFRKVLEPKREELDAMMTQLGFMKKELQRVQQDLIEELQRRLGES